MAFIRTASTSFERQQLERDIKRYQQDIDTTLTRIEGSRVELENLLPALRNQAEANQEIEYKIVQADQMEEIYQAEFAPSPTWQFFRGKSGDDPMSQILALSADGDVGMFQSMFNRAEEFANVIRSTVTSIADITGVNPTQFVRLRNQAQQPKEILEFNQEFGRLNNKYESLIDSYDALRARAQSSLEELFDEELAKIRTAQQMHDEASDKRYRLQSLIEEIDSDAITLEEAIAIFAEDIDFLKEATKLAESATLAVEEALNSHDPRWGYIVIEQ